MTIRALKGYFSQMGQKSKNMDKIVSQVKLKPLFGMKPGLYLTVFYLFIILLILFFVGFLPGIIKSGKRLTFSSETKPAVIFLDGNYIGSTTATVFVKPGNHTVTFSFEKELTTSVDFNVSRPIFLTWLFPRKQTVVSESLINDKSTFSFYLDKMFDQVVYWSAYYSNDNHHRPPLFEQVAFSALSSNYKNSQLLTDFYKSVFLFIEDENQLKEVEASLMLLKENSYFSPAEEKVLDILLSKIESLFKKKESQKENLKTNEINFTKVQNGFKFEEGSYLIGEAVNLNYPLVNKMSKEVRIKAFSVSSSLVTEYQWALFIQENPYWAKNNLNQLIEDGMVDENYLAGVFPTVVIQSNKAIRNISYKSALAYTKWLTENSDYTYFLPTDSQWEIASLSEAALNMGSSMWEFTASPYIPLSRYLNYGSLFESSFTDIIVKGVHSSTVGIMQQDECSEHCSFRIAWND